MHTRISSLLFARTTLAIAIASVAVANLARSQELEITNLQTKLGFSKSTSSAGVTGLVPLPAGYSLANGTGVVSIGTAEWFFLLDSKGSGVNGKNSFKAKYSQRDGAWSISAKVGGGADLLAIWATNGLVNASIATGDVVDLPIMIQVNDQAFSNVFSLHYSASAGKSGATGSLKCSQCH